MAKSIYPINIMSLSFIEDDINYLLSINVKNESYNQYTMEVTLGGLNRYDIKHKKYHEDDSDEDYDSDSDDDDDYDSQCLYVNNRYQDKDWTKKPIIHTIDNLKYTITISKYITQTNYNSFNCTVIITNTTTNNIIIRNTCKCFVPIDKELCNKPSTVISDNIHKFLDEINEFEPIEETVYTSSDAFHYILEKAFDYTNIYTNLKKKLIKTCYKIINSDSDDYNLDYKKLVNKCNTIVTKLR